MKVSRLFLKEFFEIKYWHNGGMVDTVDSKRSVHRLCICTGDDLAGPNPACATFIRGIGVTVSTWEFDSQGGVSITSFPTKSKIYFFSLIYSVRETYEDFI